MDKIISALVAMIVDQKKLQFPVSETNFDERLYEGKILKVEGDWISINNFRLISKHFIEIYKEKLGFELSENFKSNAIFLKKIEDDFTLDGYIEDYHILERELWKFVVKESNSEYKCSFNDYLDENIPEGIYRFIDAYSDLLAELDLTENEILENAITLAEITKSDVTYNLPLSSVLNGIKNKCKAQYDTGVKLLTESLKLNDDKENIISAIVSGLYELKRDEFYESVLKKIIEEEIKLNGILFGLSNVSPISITDCNLFKRLINDYRQKDSLLFSTQSIVFSILKSNNTQHHDFCFKVLEDAIKNEKTAYHILRNVRFIENYSQEKVSLIIKLVNQEYFTIKKYAEAISQIFWNIKGFDAFKKVTLSITETKPFEKFIDSFQSFLHTVETIELDKFVIELLIDNSANKRHFGIELFDKMALHRAYRFSFNILEIPPLSQYKLWVALTQNFHEPKKRIPALLPLIDSDSEFVKESFLFKLEEMSEDYGGHVTKALEDNLDKSNSAHSNVIERVKRYIEDFSSKNIDLKTPILELNPYHTHYKSIIKHHKLFSKKMTRTVEKSAKENSLLSILGSNTIQLAKGGGWQIGPKKEISQLGQVGLSFAMPRGYFINPNEFEITKGLEMRRNWTDNDFIEVLKILENEQQ